MFPRRNTQLPPARRQILVVDDQPLARRGLKALIDAESDLIVCAEAATQEDALRAIATAPPDLAVVDPSLGHGDGLKLIGEIRSRNADLRVLALTMHRAPVYVRRAFAAGASGFVTKSKSTETLLTAIRSVLCGHTYGRPGADARPPWGIPPSEN